MAGGKGVEPLFTESEWHLSKKYETSQGGQTQRRYLKNLKLRRMTGSPLKVEKGIRPVTKSPTRGVVEDRFQMGPQ
jgi:hypothetical protein